MIIQISRFRLILYTLIITTLLMLWLVIGFFVTHSFEKSPEGTVVVNFKFLAPMKPSAVELLTLKNESGSVIPLKHVWLTASTLRVEFEEKGYPRGQSYSYSFDWAPSMIWPFRVWGSGELQPKIKLRFIGIENSDRIPSRGPVTFQFNSAVKPEELNKYFHGPLPGRIEPQKEYIPDSGYVYDYSRWHYWPGEKMKNTNTYSIIIEKGLTSLSGSELDTRVEANFTTTPEFLIIENLPRSWSDSIWLTREISIIANQKIKTANVNVEGLPGSVYLSDNKVTFIPHRLMLPGTTYQVKASLVSSSNETLEHVYTFRTTNLGASRWLEVKLGPEPLIYALEGSTTIKTISVNVKPGLAIPRGTLYEQSRNNSSNSNPEGCWIHLNADLLLHSLNSSVDNHSSLGLPKSYSCFYLNKEDLEWLLNNMPQGFMVIIH